MATDLSLNRLRELLRSVRGCCEASTAAIGSILGALWEQGEFVAWWKKYSRVVWDAIGYGYKAKSVIANAATLCAKNGLNGDASDLRDAEVQLNQNLTDMIACYHSSNQPDQPRDAQQVEDWRSVQMDLWVKLLCGVSNLDNTAASLLNCPSFEDAHPLVDDVTSDREAAVDADENAANHDIPTCFVTLSQMAGIVNRDKRTLERLAAKAKFPLPAVEGGGGKPHEWKWSEVRPILESEYGRPLPEIFPADRFLR